jgi:UDP-N-acetyl-D-mannosaminuronic acid dehydrogenase
MCERKGLNYQKIADAANTQPYCRLHRPGYVGGHCIPYYPHFIMDEKTQIINICRKTNEQVALDAVNRCRENLKEKGLRLKDANIMILGIAYRKGADTTTHSMAIELNRILIEEGANVFCQDPRCDEEDAKRLKIVWKEDFEGIDVLIIATDHEEYKNLDFSKIAQEMRNKIIIDYRNIIPREEAEKNGFVVSVIGE